MNTTDEDDIELNNRDPLKFNLFLIFSIASNLCTIFLFYRFITNQSFRRSIYNHVIFLLLLNAFLTNIIPLPFTIYFFDHGHVLIQTDIFCSIWNWFLYSLCLSNLYLMTFNCCERHLFIFHNHLFRVKSRRRIFHYLPMIICLVYPFLFYTYAIFGTSCIPTYDYRSIFCLWPCYYNNNYWLGYYDLIVNNCLTIFLIVIFSLILVIRVMKQKYRMRQQAFKWRRDRKMLLQLLSISILYIIFWLPDNYVSLIEMWEYTFLLDLEINVFLVGPLFSNILYPLICLLSYPEFISRKRRVNIQIVPI